MSQRQVRNYIVSLLYSREPTLLLSASEICGGTDEGQAESSAESIALRGCNRKPLFGA